MTADQIWVALPRHFKEPSYDLLFANREHDPAELLMVYVNSKWHLGLKAGRKESDIVKNIIMKMGHKHSEFRVLCFSSFSAGTLTTYEGLINLIFEYQDIYHLNRIQETVHAIQDLKPKKDTECADCRKSNLPLCSSCYKKKKGRGVKNENKKCELCTGPHNIYQCPKKCNNCARSRKTLVLRSACGCKPPEKKEVFPAPVILLNKICDTLTASVAMI